MGGGDFSVFRKESGFGGGGDSICVTQIQIHPFENEIETQFH